MTLYLSFHTMVSGKSLIILELALVILLLTLFMGSSMKPAFRIHESTSVVTKTSKEISKVNPNVPETTKRSSLGANRVKTDSDSAKTVAGRGTQASKGPVSSGARRVLPKPSTSLKPSSLGHSSVTKTQSTRSSTSDKSGSTSSDNGGKSPVATVRRRVATRTINPPSSGSTVKTPSRSSLKSRSTSKNSTISAYLMSSKISSNVSPASSISEWSSASSSSSSVNQRSNKSRTSVGSSSCKSLDIDTSSLDMKTHSDNQIPNGQANRGKVLAEKNVRKSVVQTGTLPHSASMRPSGLRMPSPKIGFFDGGKAVRTPNGTALQAHSSLAVVVSKTGAGISSKVGKLPPGRVLTALTNMKIDAENPNSPLFSLERSQPSTNLNLHDEKVAESYSKSEGFGGKEYAEAKCDTDAGFGVMLNQNLGVPKNDRSMERNGDPCLKEVKLVGFEGDDNDSNSNSTVDQRHLRDLLSNLDGKENIHSADQVNGPGKHGGGMKADTDFQIDEATSEICASRTLLAVKNSSVHSARLDFSIVSADLVLEKADVDLPHLEGDHRESIKQPSC